MTEQLPFQNFFKMLSVLLTVIVVLIILIVLLYSIVIQKEVKWRSQIVHDLCKKSNMEFNEGNPAFFEPAICYKQEGNIRKSYFAPKYWDRDFNMAENQYLETRRK